MTRTSVGTAGAATIAALAYGWWFTERRPFSSGALDALAAAAVVVVGVAQVYRHRARHTPQEAPDRGRWFRRGAGAWSALAVAIVAWELLALGSQPRSAHPTISSMVESVEQYHVLRLALFVLWVGLGWVIAS